MWVDKEKLKCHTQIHTGERPYQSKDCSYAAAQFRLTRHRITQTITGEKPYECNICMMRFRHTNSLKKHVHNKKQTTFSVYILSFVYCSYKGFRRSGSHSGSVASTPVARPRTVSSVQSFWTCSNMGEGQTETGLQFENMSESFSSYFYTAPPPKASPHPIFWNERLQSP